MKIIEEYFPLEERKLDSFEYYFNNLRWATFDIETTGLSPKNSQLILSGIATEEDGKMVGKQIFAQGDDEKLVIEETLKVFKELDMIITFNGASFDVPFFRERALKNGFEDVYIPYNLDIYKLIKNYSDVGKVTPNLKQKTIENYLGIWTYRKDEIDGAESINLYIEYLNSKSKEIEEKILLHNMDDIKQLYRLMKILNKVDFHKALFDVGFLVDGCKIENITLDKSFLKIVGSQEKLDYIGYFDEIGLGVNFSKPKFEIKIAFYKYENLKFLNLHELDLPIETFVGTNAILKDKYLLLDNNRELSYYGINALAILLINKILKKEYK